MNWKKIRLELADTRDHPRGSVSRGYLIYAPLDGTGRVDGTSLAQAPHRAVVRRFWSTEPDEKGELAWVDGRFVFRCPGKPDRVLLNGTPLQVGAKVDVLEGEGDPLPFRVASISGVGRQLLPS